MSDDLQDIFKINAEAIRLGRVDALVRCAKWHDEKAVEYGKLGETKGATVHMLSAAEILLWIEQEQASDNRTNGEKA